MPGVLVLSTEQYIWLYNFYALSFGRVNYIILILVKTVLKPCLFLGHRSARSPLT